MNIYTLGSLLALGVSLFMAYIVYFRNPKGAINIIFAFLCVLLAYIAFTELGLRTADNLDTARLWMKASSFWPVAMAALLHFSLVFTEGPGLLRSGRFCALLYIPALAISFVELLTEHITKEPIEKYWGWTYQAEDNLAIYIALCWCAIMLIPAVYLCWRTYFKAAAGRRKRQAWYISIGISIPVVTGLIANWLLPMFEIRVPEGVTFPFAVGSAFVGYAIWKHGLFTITPGTAADTVLSIMSDCLFLVNGRGRIVMVNASALKTLGYEQEDLKGRKFETLFWVEREDSDPPGVENTGLEDLVEAIIGQDRVVAMVTKAGQRIPVSVAISRIKADDDERRGFVCIARDITQYKEAQDKLLSSYEREVELRQNLEREINKRVEFTRALVHEMKTPLTPMLASSQLLVEEVREKHLRRLAENIGQGAWALSKRVDELLDVAKGDLGVLEMNLRETDLLPLSQAVVDEMTPMASANEQYLIPELPSSLPLVMADEVRIKQVIVNLLSNAFKFTPMGGKVILRAMEKDGTLTVEVQDTGIGIDKEDFTKIFEPYYQAANDKNHLGGLGLGLALCRKIVELHGGRIWVESEVGRGTTFGFSVPVYAGAAEEHNVASGD